jgi:hypothetical protein
LLKHVELSPLRVMIVSSTSRASDGGCGGCGCLILGVDVSRHLLLGTVRDLAGSLALCLSGSQLSPFCSDSVLRLGLRGDGTSLLGTCGLDFLLSKSSFGVEVLDLAVNLGEFGLNCFLLPS